MALIMTYNYKARPYFSSYKVIILLKNTHYFKNVKSFKKYIFYTILSHYNTIFFSIFYHNNFVSFYSLNDNIHF